MTDSNAYPAVPKPRHYIVVVHGIGEQKLNQTTTSVVHRFAEARQKESEESKVSFKNLLPSYLSAQSVRQGGRGHGWSEFNGIPVKPEYNTGKFDGTPATESSGHNFRFVDLHWQHILHRHQERYSSPIEKWAPSLLARCENHKITPEGGFPSWTLPMLKSIVKVALPVKKMLAFKYSGLSKTVFDDFLGDVHLYGDYSRTRGRAVRHFHVILDEIMQRDFIDWCRCDRKRMKKNSINTKLMPYQPPDFTIIAHSLGSIMSFDALVYAHAKKEVRKAQGASWNKCQSLPFLGYTYQVEAEKVSREYIIGGLEELEKNNVLDAYKVKFPSIDNILKRTSHPKIPLLTWLGQVKNFITIGSPIDKYHVIWWQKYLHMELPKQSSTPQGNNDKDEWLDPPNLKERIHHYNFCDEQDPVGHHLDVARGTVNYKKIFDSDSAAERDILFRRYGKPGIAHNMYWEDKELFKGFVNVIIEGGDETDYFLKPGFRERKKAFKQALLWAYFRFPFFAALLTGFLFIYAIFGETLIYRIVAGIGAILLWIQPNLLNAYRDESDPEKYDDTGSWQTIKTSRLGKLRLQRGILARLVAGMVEWRRILFKLSEGIQTTQTTPRGILARLVARMVEWQRILFKLSEGIQTTQTTPLNKNERVAFFKTTNSSSWSFWWRFTLRIFAALVFAYMFINIATFINIVNIATQDYTIFSLTYWKALWDCLSLETLKNPSWQQPIGISSIILAISYICTMVYVAYQYMRSQNVRN